MQRRQNFQAACLQYGPEQSASASARSLVVVLDAVNEEVQPRVPVTGGRKVDRHQRLVRPADRMQRGVPVQKAVSRSEAEIPENKLN